MFKYIIEGLGNIDILGVLALLTFVAMFLIGSITIFRRNPAFIEKMANLPLEDNSISNEETTPIHEK